MIHDVILDACSEVAKRVKPENQVETLDRLLKFRYKITVDKSILEKKVEECQKAIKNS